MKKIEKMLAFYSNRCQPSPYLNHCQTAHNAHTTTKSRRPSLEHLTTNRPLKTNPSKPLMPSNQSA